MISVITALSFIQEHAKILDPIRLGLDEAFGKVLAEDIYSPVHMPAFNQSAMDGYAINLGQQNLLNTYLLAGKIPAGESSSIPVNFGEACRIFTGAPLPPSTNTVIMQEHAQLSGRLVQFSSPKPISTGSNVRLMGSEIKKDELALKKFSLLNAGAIGFLASLGITELWVYQTPKIALIITGNELTPPGKPLGNACVYESNSYTLKSALKQISINDIDIQWVKDEVAVLEAALQKAFETFDLVLVTGGVSVGEYDLVPQALQNCGVQTIFHKIAQKPGKPLFFGIRDKPTANNLEADNKTRNLVFGLPGNPASVLTCFYWYVLPAIQHLMGRKKPFLTTIEAIIKGNYTKAAGLTHFLKGKIENGMACPLPAQESFRLSSFSTCDCLIEIPPETITITDGESVKLTYLTH